MSLSMHCILPPRPSLLPPSYLGLGNSLIQLILVAPTSKRKAQQVRGTHIGKEGLPLVSHVRAPLEIKWAREKGQRVGEDVGLGE